MDYLYGLNMRHGKKKEDRHGARISVNGGQQQYGVNYWETFSLVVAWRSIRLILTLSIIHEWHTRQNDFVLVYPQVELEGEI